MESRQKRKSLSKRALRAELVRRGVEREAIDEALGRVSGEDEYAAALALAEVRASRLTGLDRETKYRRLAGVLQRRGFSGGIVTSVLKQVLDIDEEF